MRHILFTAVTVLSHVLLTTTAVAQSASDIATPVQHLGFDRNLYPGDASLPLLRKHFAFSGYWLNNPPGETSNTWIGRRDVLLKNNFGFLVLFNGREDAQILGFKRRGTSPDALGKQDAARAIAAARREHFPDGTIIFLDQEEGGRL